MAADPSVLSFLPLSLEGREGSLFKPFLANHLGHYLTSAKIFKYSTGLEV